MICSRGEILVYLRKANTTLTVDDDALLDLLHPLVESSIQNYLRQEFNYQPHVEYLPVGGPDIERDYPLDQYQKQGDVFSFVGGSGGESLILTHKPVALTGLRVWEDTSAYAGQGATPFAAATELTIGTDFYLDVADNSNISTSGILYRIGGWPNEPRCVKVSYYGGYTAAQLVGGKAGSLKLATLMQFAFEFNATKQLNAKSGPGGAYKREKIGKYEYEMSDSVAEYLAGITGRDILPRVKELLQPYRTYKYL